MKGLGVRHHIVDLGLTVEGGIFIEMSGWLLLISASSSSSSYWRFNGVHIKLFYFYLS